MPTPRPHTPPPRCLGLAIAALCFWLSAEAAAQDPPEVADLTRAQTEAINKAFALAGDGKNKEALDALDALVAELDMDLLHLNRGRVLQKLGRCTEARRAFDKVLGAPRDPQVSRADIRGYLESFVAELEKDCPADLKVVCPFPEMTLSIDGGPPETCREAPFRVLSGTRKVVGTVFGQRVEQVVQLKGAQETTIALTLDGAALVNAGRGLLGQRAFDRAMTLFEAALRENREQQTYLYIAEALVGQRDCQSALVALREARKAPPSSALSPIEFTRQSKDLRTALGTSCGEPVALKCKPEGLTIDVDGGVPRVCGPQPIFMAAGNRTVTASLDLGNGEAPRTQSRQVTVLAGSSTQLEFDLSEPPLLGELGWWGVGTAASGAALLGAGLIVDAAFIGPEIDDYNRTNAAFRDAQGVGDTRETLATFQGINAGVIITGGAALVVGGGLVLADVLSRGDEESEDVAPSVLFFSNGRESRVTIGGSW